MDEIRDKYIEHLSIYIGEIPEKNMTEPQVRKHLDETLHQYALNLGFKPREMAQWTYWGAVFYCG